MNEDKNIIQVRKPTFLMLYNIYFVGYKVFEILLKNRKLLTVITNGKRAPLDTNKIYPAPYIPLCRSSTLSGG